MPGLRGSAPRRPAGAAGTSIAFRTRPAGSAERIETLMDQPKAGAAYLAAGGTLPTNFRQRLNQLLEHLQAIGREWEAETGETIPASIEEWERLAVRAGIPPEKLWDGEWSPRKIAPYIVGYLDRLRDGRQAAALAGDKAPPTDPLTNDSAYVPAGQLWQEHFKTYRKFKTWLDRTAKSEIRRQKPATNQLKIHAADWAKYWAAQSKKTFDRLDKSEPPEIVDTFVEAEDARERYNDLHAAKQRRKHRDDASLHALVKRIAGK